MRVFVTGGCGFIGSHLVGYHLAKGDEVHAMDDLTTGRLENIIRFQSNPLFKFEKEDILTCDLKRMVGKAELVYHMAAVVGRKRVLEEPLKLTAINIAGCERLFRAISASKHRPRVLIASSSEVYGHSKKAYLSEEDHLIIESVARPFAGYAITKLADEALGLGYDRIENIPTTVLRLFNVIGPGQTGQYGFVVPRFIQQACLGDPITVYGDGTQTRSFCDIRDLVVALDILARNLNTRGEIVNVGHDGMISINELAKFIRKRAKSKSAIHHMSYEEGYGQEIYDIMRRRPDLTKFFKMTNFTHQWNLEKSVDDLIHRFRQKQK